MAPLVRLMRLKPFLVAHRARQHSFTESSVKLVFKKLIDGTNCTFLNVRKRPETLFRTIEIHALRCKGKIEGVSDV